METKEKNSYLKIAVIGLTIVAVILAILLAVKQSEISKVNKKYDEIKTELEQLQDGVLSFNNSSDDNLQKEYDEFDGRADYDFETDELSQEYWLETYEDLLGKFFAVYDLTDDGLSIIFTRDENYYPISLELYIDEREKDKKYQETDETTTINGTEYKLYRTHIDFEEYKDSLMEMMSEDVFENYFTDYAKDIDGELYIVGESTDNANEEFSIEDMELVKEDTYKVSYTHTNGDAKEEKEVTVKFGLNEAGSVIVEKINM